MKGFVCQAEEAFCPNRGHQTLPKTPMLGNDKVRLSSREAP